MPGTNPRKDNGPVNKSIWFSLSLPWSVIPCMMLRMVNSH